MGSCAYPVPVVETENAVVSFLRHADLSPDGQSALRNTKGNPASQIPLRTHRWDESDRVFLAGCSSAEPASACSTRSDYQNDKIRFVSDPSAGPCVCRDYAREFRLPIHPVSCFKVGRFTLTQSSGTAGGRCSRKWMSGRAASALVLLRDRGQCEDINIYSPGEPSLPGQGESPFPLDYYLSWTSLTGLLIRLPVTQDFILGGLAREDWLRAHRSTSFPLQPSLRDCERPKLNG